MDIFKLCTTSEIMKKKLVLAGVAKDTDDAELASECTRLIDQIENEQKKRVAEGKAAGAGATYDVATGATYGGDDEFDLLKEQKKIKSVTGLGGHFLPESRDENYEIARSLIDRYLV